MLYNRIRNRLNSQTNLTFENLPETIINREKALKEKLSQSLYSDEGFDQFIEANSDWTEFLKVLKEDYPKYYKLRYASISKSTEDLESKVEGNRTIVRYAFIDSKLYAFVISNSGTKFFELNNQNLDAQIALTQPEDVTTNYNFKVLYNLYQSLWEPFANEIKTDEVTIIPDRSLFNLNFEILTPKQISSFDEFTSSSLMAKHTVFGDRSFKHCDILDMTFACVGAVDAMHNSIDWVKQDKNRKAVVIASDLSKYDINSTGEYTQGAGAVAVLISHDPSILEINDVWGVASKSEGDFFKPRRVYKKTDLLKAVFKELKLDTSEDHVKSFINNIDSDFWSDNNEIVEVFKEEPVFDGQFSNACYSDRITEALKHFEDQKSVDFVRDWNQLIFHLPYAYHGRRIIFDNWLNWIKDTDQYNELENQIGSYNEAEKKDWLKKAYKSDLYKAFVDSKIAAGELASSEIGNMYTASIFMSLLSYLSHSVNNWESLEHTTVGFVSYGSGSKSKVFEGKIVSGWESKIKPVGLFENLQSRQSIDVETYESIHRSAIESPVFEGSKISLDYVEKEAMNYGLRRYSVK